MNQSESCRVTICNFFNVLISGASMFLGFTNVLLFVVLTQNQTIYDKLQTIILSNFVAGVLIMLNATNGIIGSIFESYSLLTLNKVGMCITIMLQITLITMWYSQNFDEIINENFLKQHLNETFSDIDNNANIIHFYEQKFRCCLFESYDEFQTSDRSNDDLCPAKMTCLNQMKTNAKIIVKDISTYLIVILILSVFGAVPVLYLFITYQKLSYNVRVDDFNNNGV